LIVFSDFFIYFILGNNLYVLNDVCVVIFN